ncbi:amidase [Roseovarius azorensis]|uniref:Amidase n=1 Tax=Roseovarius azorensis TaxID=1287727 RepID=A0A1H7XI14_9RHOB|nr:amidase [Roseovarius azorensis]SEM32807.1 amidase [Roseovarius azorensis]
MTDIDLCYLSATELAQILRTGKLSPVELVANCLSRINQVNPVLNCFTEIYADEALEKARQAEAASGNKDSLPPLHGIPIAIKDFAPMKGRISTKGSHVFREDVATFDAIIVEKLLEAGAIVVGRTTTPEFTYSSLTDSPLWGITRNPWNPERTPGGSSGGSAAAVASGCVPLAEGTDSGGSVRIPASHCGIVGMKPSFGRIPFEFMESQYDWMTSHGPLSRTVEDAALFISLCQGPDLRDLQAVLPRLDLARLTEKPGKNRRLALSVDLGCYNVDPDVAANLRTCADAFAEAGYEIEEIDLGWTVEFATAWWSCWDVFMAANFGRYLDRFEDRIHPSLVRAIRSGRTISAVELRQYEAIFTQAWRKLSPVFARCDALICPTESIPAPPVEYDEAASMSVLVDKKLSAMDMTMQFNAMLLPAISVPSGMSRDNLPTGLQIVGPRGEDDLVLGLAMLFQAQRPWAMARPPI